MTEVAAGFPAPRSDADETLDVAHVRPEPSRFGVDDEPTSYVYEPAADTPAVNAIVVDEPTPPGGLPIVPAPEQSRFRAAAGEAAGKVGDFASDAAGRAGELANEAATKAGELATRVADRIRNNAELSAERGTTTIADEVVEKIAAFATREVPGVYDLGGDVARVFASVKERIGLGEADDAADRGVKVRLEGSTATVRITIVIEYGYVVYSVTEKVRAKVISSVENLLGLEVTAVDIVVDDVHIDESRFASAAPAE